VKLIKDKETFTGQVRIVSDPKSVHSAADRALQQQTMRKLYEMQERLAFVDDVITDARDKAKERAKKLDSGDAVAKDIEAFADKLDTLHKTLVATKEGPITGEEQLRERIVEIYGWVTQYGGRPTESQLARIPVLEKEIDTANSKFATIIDKDLSAMNAKLAGKKCETIKVLTKQEWDKKQQDK